MHNRSYNEQDAIQRLLLFEEGLSRLIELMKIEKKDVLGNDMDFFVSVNHAGCMPQMS